MQNLYNLEVWFTMDKKDEQNLLENIYLPEFKHMSFFFPCLIICRSFRNHGHYFPDPVCS